MNVKTLTLEELADILERTQVEKMTDTGAEIVHEGAHPGHGRVVLISSALGNHFLISPCSM